MSLRPAVAELQRKLLARDVVEAYDLVDQILGCACDLNSVNCGLTSHEIDEIRSRLTEAKEQLFLARVTAEKGDPS